MLKPLGTAFLAAGMFLIAGCNDGPTSIAIPTPVPLTVLNTGVLTFANAPGGTIRATDVELIPRTRQLIITGTFENITSPPAAPIDGGVGSTAVQVRRAIVTADSPSLTQASGPIVFSLDVTSNPTTAGGFTGTFSGVFTFDNEDAEDEIDAVRRGEYYLNFTTEANRSTSASRAQMIFIQ